MLGQYLRNRRIELGLSQEKIGTKLKYSSPQIVSNWERGVCSPPTAKFIAIAKILKIPKSEFLQIMMADYEIQARKILKFER